MPQIKAFNGWRYNAKRVGAVREVVCPPYDVISQKQQEAYYTQNPHNVIRLELGKESAGDSPKDNRYTRALKTWKQWVADQALIQEASPSLYVYVQNYLEEGQKKQRLGFLAAMKIDEKAVRKHENTLAGPKKDRLDLLKAVGVNLSPIFGLFEDSPGAVQKLLQRRLKDQPAYDVTLEGVRHRLYIESDPKVIQSVCSRMSQKPMYIADGHHRFEVSNQYKQWRQAQGDTSGNWEYVMTYFCDFKHNPFKIFPTHRLIRVPKGRPWQEAVSGLGTLAKASSPGKLTALKKYQFGFYSKKEGAFILTLSKKVAARVKNNPVDRLDVAVLHEFIIKPCFGIAEIEKSPDIDFTRDAQEARAKVDAGQFDLAIFLRSTTLEDMILASKKGLKMPQKSTYFYPKLLTGLVFHGVV